MRRLRGNKAAGVAQPGWLMAGRRQVWVEPDDVAEQGLSFMQQQLIAAMSSRALGGIRLGGGASEE